MKNAVALVTGGTGGIGTAICQYLYREGASVIAAYNIAGNTVQAKDWQQQMCSQNYQFEITYCDVSNFESCAAMVLDVEKKIGPVDILVNNAGITRDATLKNLKPEHWNVVLRTNLDSVFNVTKNVIDKMIARKFGRIINIASINGQKGQFGQTNYCASKAGIHGFTKALAQEVARHGITVNTISPGYVATSMVKKLPEEILNKIIAQIPLGRLAEPDEIARLVAFLAAKESGFITGANIAINGGHHMY